MVSCPVCHEPCPPGESTCARHRASAPASPARTEAFRIPVAAAPPGEPRTEQFRLPDALRGPPEPQAPRFAESAFSSGDPTASAGDEDALETPVETPIALVTVKRPSPDAQATGIIALRQRISGPPVASPKAPTPVALLAHDPDAQATGVISLIPRALAVLADNPDAQATGVISLPLAGIATPDGQSTVMSGGRAASAPFSNPDAQATVSRPAAAVEAGEAATLPTIKPVARALAAPPPDAVVVSQPTPNPAAAKAAGKKGGYIGRVFGQRFEVKSFIGAGGFGATYLAQDSRLHREVVVKMLRPMTADPSPFEVEMRRRFTNEAVTLAHLLHPNITQVFDHGEEPDGSTWIAMEFVNGRTLGAVGKAEKTLQPDRAGRLGGQIASALAFAHARGIVHRDLKPDNVMVTDSETGNEQAKVLDFGIARITDAGAMGIDKAQAQLTQIGAFLGTPAFMSPEQAEGAEVGPPSDVYSLGVMLYLLVTGLLPGRIPSAWNPMTTVAYVVSPFEPVRRLRPDCPALLAELIEQMLVKESHKRTLSAAQIQAELGSLQPTTYQPGGAVRLPRHHAPGSRTTFLAVAALVASLGAIGAILWSQSMRAAEPAPVVTPLAAPTPPPVVPAAVVPDPALLREAQITDLLRRARAGDPSTSIERDAAPLLESGKDPRLSLARGIARRNGKDLEGALILFEEAKTLAGDTALGREAAASHEEALAEKLRRAERVKNRPAKPSDDATARPEY